MSQCVTFLSGYVVGVWGPKCFRIFVLQLIQVYLDFENVALQTNAFRERERETETDRQTDRQLLCTYT